MSDLLNWKNNSNWGMNQQMQDNQLHLPPISTNPSFFNQQMGHELEWENNSNWNMNQQVQDNQQQMNGPPYFQQSTEQQIPMTGVFPQNASQVVYTHFPQSNQLQSGSYAEQLGTVNPAYANATFAAQNNLPVISYQQFFNQPMMTFPNYNKLLEQNFMLTNEVQTMKNYLQQLILEHKIAQIDYQQDNITGVWYYQDRRRGIVPMCLVNIPKVLVIKKFDDTFEAIKVEYQVGSKQFHTVIPYHDFITKNLLPYFPAVPKYRICGDKDLKELLFMLICRAEVCECITMPKRSGWYKVKQKLNSPVIEKEWFIYSTFFDKYFSDYLSDSIKNRQITFSQRRPQDIINEYLTVLPNHWKFKLLWLIHISSLLLTLFSGNGVEPSQIVVLTSSNNEMTKLLISIIKTNTYTSFSTCSLTASKKEIQKELDETNDGVALFRDITNFDDENSTANALKYIRNDLLHADRKDDYAGHITVILTSWISSQMPFDEIFLIPFDDIQIPENCSAERLQKLSEEFDSMLILFVSTYFNNLQNRFKNFIYENRNQAVKELPANRADMFLMIIMVLDILKNEFNISFFNGEEQNEITELFRKDEEYEDRAFAIIKEFVSVASELIRSSQLKILDKKHSKTIENVEDTLIVTDNSLAFSRESIDKVILPRMKKTKQRKILIKALEDYGYLQGTARKKQPVNRINAQGEVFRFRPYGIDRNIFDDDVRQKMDSLFMGEYFCTETEIPKGQFLPLIHSNGRVAGKMIQPLSNKNNIIYITGISESGKSYALVQIVAFLSELKHKIIIFDNSNSFSDKALNDNLPANFVQDHITIHDLKGDGIPVNLFEINDNMDSADEIAKILFAPFSAPAQIQFSGLKSCLSQLISDGDFETNQAEKLLNSFRYGKKYLTDRFGAILTELKKYKMIRQNWKQFIDNSKQIIIIRSSARFGDKNSNPIFDMMLAKFYNFKMNHPDMSVDILIDELNSQNTGINSPIRSIVTNCRKAHTAFIGATQEYKKGSTINETMSQAKTQIFLKPTPASEDDVADALRYGKKKRAYFDGMMEGDAIVKGDFYSTEQDRNCPVTLCGKICTYEEWLPFIEIKTESNINN